MWKSPIIASVLKNLAVAASRFCRRRRTHSDFAELLENALCADFAAPSAAAAAKNCGLSSVVANCETTQCHNFGKSVVFRILFEKIKITVKAHFIFG